MQQAFIFTLLLCFNFQAVATEQDDLALVLKQISLIQTTLERAQNSTLNHTEIKRFHFDYDSINRDLEIIKKGVDHYLTPSRQQPRNPQQLMGNYIVSTVDD